MNKEINTPHLEYNLAGGLLLTVRENDLQRLCEQVAQSGYSHACVLPFRALTHPGSVEQLQRSPLTIIHLEEAWNPTNQDTLGLAVAAGIIGHARRILGDTTEPPILQDAFFPARKTCDRLFKDLMEIFPETKFISHKVLTDLDSNRWLLEINPGIKMSPEQILAEAKRQGVGLVFDPRHLLPSENTVSIPTQPTKPTLGKWEGQFRIFSKDIEVVDINPPNPTDVSDLLTRKGLLKELAEATRELPNVKFLRVEIPMPIASRIPFSPQQQNGFEFLKEIGEALKTA